MVRRPAGRDAVRDPYVAVTLGGAPAAVLIQVLVPDHIARNVACGNRIVSAAIAIVGPAVELVVPRRLEVLVVAQTGPEETITLPGIDEVRRAFAIDLGLAVARYDGRRIAGRIDVDPVSAWPANRIREIRRVELNHIFRAEAPHPNVQRALRYLQLRDAVVEIEQCHAGAAAHVEHGRADLQLGTRAGIHPQSVACDQWPVYSRFHPIVLAGRREAYGAADIAQARDACRRVGAGPTRQYQRDGAEQQRNNPIARMFFLHGRV